jgi:hypothetical protein
LIACRAAFGAYPGCEELPCASVPGESILSIVEEGVGTCTGVWTVGMTPFRRWARDVFIALKRIFIIIEQIEKERKSYIDGAMSILEMRHQREFPSR